MRLTFVRWSLLLVLVSMAAGQQLTPEAQHPAKQAAAKSSTAHDAQARNPQTRQTPHPSATKAHSTARRNAARPAYRPEYTQNSVEVMNGASTQKVVFHIDEPATGLSKNNAPAPRRVEVVNGTSTDTQYFSADSAQQNSAPKEPVVLAVQSGDTRVVGGNKHPVVTGITTVQAGDARSASGGGQKLATKVAPQAKRPAYQPDAH